MLIDITDRKRIEERLLASEHRFRQIAETVHEVFWIAGPNITQMTYVSPGYERVWGRSCQSLYDNPRSFLDALHVDDQEYAVDLGITPTRTAVRSRISRGPSRRKYPLGLGSRLPGLR